MSGWTADENERAIRLRHGWQDETGHRWTRCVMRPARVRDEVRALGDFRVFLRPESLTHVLLARVIVGLENGERADVGFLEGLNAEDVLLLKEAYCEINGYR